MVTTDVIIQRLSTGLLASGQKIQVRDIESEVRIAKYYSRIYVLLYTCVI